MKTIFEKLASLLVPILMNEKLNRLLLLILMAETVNGQFDVYSQGLQLKESPMINIAWRLFYDTHFPGLGEYVRSCNASITGFPKTIEVDRGNNDGLFRGQVSLCPDLGSFLFFLYESFEGSGEEIKKLTSCFLNQTTTQNFCKEQQTLQDDGIWESQLGWIIPGVIVGAILLALLMCCLIISCRAIRSGYTISKTISSTSSTTTAANESLALLPKTSDRNRTDNINSSARAGMFARALHHVEVAFRSLRKPTVPSANIDTDKTSNVESNDKDIGRPLL